MAIEGWPAQQRDGARVARPGSTIAHLADQRLLLALFDDACAFARVQSTACIITCGSSFALCRASLRRTHVSFLAKPKLRHVCPGVRQRRPATRPGCPRRECDELGYKGVLADVALWSYSGVAGCVIGERGKNAGSLAA